MKNEGTFLRSESNEWNQLWRARRRLAEFEKLTRRIDERVRSRRGR